jgi:asparagine synthetase B (glutamine-hydrolysing)
MCVPVQQHDVRSRLPYANPIRDFAFQRHATVAKHSPTKVILCGEGADELGLGYPVNKALTGPVERYLKKVSLLKSQASMTLDRVNMAGMMYSKEYRVPFLDLEFSLACLGHDQTNKELFRKFAHTLGVPKEIIDAAKYSNEETTGRAIAYD